MSNGFLTAAMWLILGSYSLSSGVDLYAKLTYKPQCEAKGGVYLTDARSCIRRDSVIPME